MCVRYQRPPSPLVLPQGPVRPQRSLLNILAPHEFDARAYASSES